MKKYQCFFCGYVYDEAVGDPDGGVAAGTKWEDVSGRVVLPVLRRRQDRLRDDGSLIRCRA